MKNSAIVAINQNNGFYLNFFLLFVVSVVYAKDYKIPRFFIETDALFSEYLKPYPGPEKNYTGIRVRDNSRLTIFEYDQTLAVVEKDPKNGRFLSCELLEVRSERDKVYALKSLSTVAPHIEPLDLKKMIELMKICQNLDLPRGLLSEQFIKRESQDSMLRRRDKRTNFEVWAIFKGIVPGTKWCGLGDKAGSYYDLGPNAPLDKCCRTHDLCPVKIMGFSRHYGILNYSYSTRTHCVCDTEFYNCLKSLNTTISNIVGNIFFGTITCLEGGYNKEKSEVKFVKKNLPY